jgi:hypothetical protein
MHGAKSPRDPSHMILTRPRALFKRQPRNSETICLITPVCGAPVQRIRYAENETNYCPGCQTEGRILADRSLSRLLKDDWPRHLDEL